MNIKEWKNDAVTIRVNYDKCKGHGECEESCPGEVYELAEGKAVAARPEDCVECCTCVSVCPEEAIEHSSCD